MTAGTLTSAAREPSSNSAYSELYVYSDSLLLWVESVLLWPGLDAFCRKKEKIEQKIGF